MSASNEAVATPFPIVGVGASAGGLEAFTRLLRALPLDTGMGFVLVQHLDPDHESQLTQILSRETALPVREITHDEQVLADHVYVIPRDTTLSIAGGALKLQPRPRTRTPHRPIDAFFESLAHDQRECAIGVVLSGTASDGTLGLEAIKAEGGITFAQDASAKHDSMPRSAVAAGFVDLVLPPEAIATELAWIAKHPYVTARSHDADAADDVSGAAVRATALEHQQERNDRRDQNGYAKVLRLLHGHAGVDFSLYKSTTIQRRIARRLLLTKQDTLESYAAFLRDNTGELEALYSDVLISVTSFFRDPETFDILRERVLPELLGQRSEDPVRVWVLGCSTGQEAYTIAIAFAETLSNAPQPRGLQVFATDLNEALLNQARSGLYAKTLTDDISPERLRRFFVEEQGGYRVNKALREMVVFARQNLIADPPFSRMDLISCRNLLIYLEPSLQRKALPTFHYALKPGGFLMLGASESIGRFGDLFEPIDRKHKIYSRKSTPVRSLPLPVRASPSEERARSRRQRPLREASPVELSEGGQGELDAEREADRITVSQFAPPGVLVDAELQILQFRGSTGAFLQPPVGKASLEVLKMAREGLLLPLRSAIEQAKKDHKPTRKDNVHVKRDGQTRSVSLEVIPLRNVAEPCFLILFEEVEPSSSLRKPVPAPAVADEGLPDSAASQIAELKTELSETREYLQAMQEQHDRGNEALQAANEEVQSANEELQSINEELETSKEELESTNEELTTVNDEMSHRNVQLNRLNDDLVNLQTSTQLAIVLLGRDLALRRFSSQAETQFGLLLADLGRPISHIRHGLVVGQHSGEGSTTSQPLDLAAMVSDVISDVREQEREVRDRNGRWHSLRVRPYLTLDNKVDGAVMVLVDIDTIKQAGAASGELAAIVSFSDDAILSTSLEGIITSWNRSAEGMFGYTTAQAVGQRLSLIVPDELSTEESDVLARVRRGERVVHFDTERKTSHGGRVHISLAVSPIKDPSGQVIGASMVARDIRERKRAEQSLAQLNAELRASEQELRRQASELANAAARRNEFLAMLGHELRNPLTAIAHGLARLAKAPEDAARAQELCGMMIRQTERIGTLLDQLLDIARVVSDRFELVKDRVDLAEVLRAAVETVKPIMDIQKHELLLTLPSKKHAVVMGDAMRLSQVVENLLTNAAKYSQEGGQIFLTLESDDDKAHIVVRDTGIGLSADFLPHVFEVFTQAPRSLDRAKGGLGLGLPLVRRLVEMHGGSVEASSPGIDQGSEFVVTLPVVPGARAPISRERKSTPAKPIRVEPHRILVVDDEEAISKVLAELLREDGHQTFAVSSGAAALEALASFHPDVVLLDLGLPGMDGFEVAKQLRARQGDERLLIIAISGYEVAPATLSDTGVDHHLIKPPNLQKLAGMLAAWA